MMKLATRKTWRSILRPGALLLGIALTLLGCAPAGGPATARDEDRAGRQGLKTLVMAVQSEPDTIVIYGRPSGTTTPNYERYWPFHGSLTRFDEAGNPTAYAAQKVPTIEDGDWKVNPDGTMEVTWKIRPDVLWHDGKPLVADDFVLGYHVALDPKMAVPALGDMVKISSVRAADASTIVMTWKELSIFGNHNQEGVPAIARHLEDLYKAGDTEAFESSQLWRSEFVGIGPFRVTKWELGSHVESEAFDRFFLGRPKIDRLIIRWVPDINVMVANLLAGVVDVAPAGSMLKPEQMVELRRQWGPEGGQVFSSPNAIRTLLLNFREGGAWAQDPRFRQAMAHALNREQLVEVLQYSFTEIAYYFQFPEHPLYRMADQRGVPKYPYDPARAQRLFAEAGWTKGADGLLRNSSGQTVPFPCCRYSDDDSNDIRESLAWGTDFKTAGIDVQHPIPASPAGLSAAEKRRVQTTGWGGRISPLRVTPRENFANFTAEQIAREETRWTGINSGGWTNPTFETQFSRAMSTLNSSQRLEIEFQLFKMIADELPILNVYYNPIGVASRKGVEGVGKAPVLNLGTSWNINTWEIR